MNLSSLMNLVHALFSADGLAGIIFLIMVAVTLLGGLMACSTERLVRSVAGLVVCFIGVAGIFYYLNSPFVAMMEILIYVGAVSVTISFAIMLAAPEQSKKTGPAGPLSGPLGFLVAGLTFGGLAVLGFRTVWPVRAKINNGSMEAIGVQLLTNYSMVFELVSVVLLVAILGAIILARSGRNN
jgi:NADH:ubiquinone oxidoreductase subunit 6 (subunit J)